MSASVVPSPMLARTAPEVSTSSPHSIAWSRRSVCAAIDAERCATSGCAQNEPARTAIPGPQGALRARAPSILQP